MLGLDFEKEARVVREGEEVMACELYKGGCAECSMFQSCWFVSPSSWAGLLQDYLLATSRAVNCFSPTEEFSVGVRRGNK